jgi:AcrR family transcriptional regulator
MNARAVARARERVGIAEQLLTATILAAIEEGTPVADIAAAAGLTRQRIYQIRDENLSDPSPTVNDAP